MTWLPYRQGSITIDLHGSIKGPFVAGSNCILDSMVTLLP